MALQASDVFVVQQQASGEIRKISVSALNQYLESTDILVFKGAADFTDVGVTPGSPNRGDMWINTALTAGNFAWTPALDTPTEVFPGDRVVYDGTGWSIIATVHDVGVVEIDGQLPIEIISDDPSKPIVKVDDATTTATGVVRLAIQDDVDNSATNRVVTADLLKIVDDKVDDAVAGGVISIQGLDPIETSTTDNGGTVNSPSISIKDAAVAQKGAIAKFDSTADIQGPVDAGGGDFDTWVGTLDDNTAVTMKAVGSHFLLIDFAQYPDA